MLRIILTALPIVVFVLSACTIYLRSGAKLFGIEDKITKRINLNGSPWRYFGWEVLSVTALVLGLIFLKKFTVVLIGLGLVALSYNAFKYRRAQRRDEKFKGITELFGIELFAMGKWYSPALQSLGVLSALLGVAMIYAAEYRDDAILGALYAIAIIFAYREQIGRAIRSIRSKGTKAGDQPAS